MAQPSPQHLQSSHVAQVARVISDAPGTLWVRASSGPSEPWPVRSALPLDTPIIEGNEVVILETAQGPVAIARIADERQPATNHEQALCDGTRIELSGDATRVRVLRRDGTPLFDYSASEGTGVITLANETVRVAAHTGDLQLVAAGAIRLQGQSVELSAKAGNEASGLSLGARRSKLESAKLELGAQELTVDAGEAMLRGQALRSEYKRAVVQAERLETTAEVVVSHARNVYQSVQELFQQQAGTLRTLVTGSVQLKAREVAHRALHAYKVRADKIHLG